MKSLAERGSIRPPRRGYLAACSRCGRQVAHSNTTGQPVPQHAKACTAADDERVDDAIEVCKAAIRHLPDRLSTRVLRWLKDWDGF